jgi:hypothetical protein
MGQVGSWHAAAHVCGGSVALLGRYAMLSVRGVKVTCCLRIGQHAPGEWPLSKVFSELCRTSPMFGDTVYAAWVQPEMLVVCSSGC